MDVSGILPGKNSSFNKNLLICVLFIIVFVIALLSSISYIEVQNELIDKNQILKDETAISVTQWITLVDQGLKMYDDTLNLEMKEGFKGFVDEYERAGRDPGQMDLAALKEGLDGTMDLYVINSAGVIEYSTYAPEVGLDFKKVPYFYEYITGLRKGHTISTDRVVREQSTGAIRKYAYMPSPDHRYLFELGLVSEQLKDRKLGLSYVQTAESLKNLNPDLESIRIFDTMGKVVGNKSYVMDPVQKTRVKKALDGRESTVYPDPEQKKEYHYLYIDLRDPDYASDMSMVVELTYTTSPMEKKLVGLFFSHLTIALLAILGSVLVSYGVVSYISRPVSEVVEDIDRIARGDLDHQIRHTSGIEFRRLEDSINAMVVSLKENIKRAEESEDALKKTNENLEEIIDHRTAALTKANEEANLYLDIMSHDINNANTVALGYAQMLIMRLAEKEKYQANRIAQSIMRSSEIIQNVATIRLIHQKNLPLERVDLDTGIRKEIDHHPDVAIHYEGKKVLVWADELLSEVFSNLIGNAVKFMDGQGEVFVRVEDEGEKVRVSVEDTGPGISDEMKGVIFTRFKKGTNKRSGKGLGLYIVRSLVEKYGGMVWAEDRVPGNPGLGAAVRFTLRKAPDDPRE
ncbi:HAMP domain-containing sensor histidine kinase [uncultured Methanofollis sp.]|uniref:sensor histidine kinase n=1 Tax=uncultured Methanofollis sp. TaxID=262500 RepID=UPI0026034C29|nr:HAMP domain-containing sensor histidine kinase [uncultured Methanofollis sp.]